MRQRVVLASDIGSGSCKTAMVDEHGRIVASAQQEYPTRYPRPGWAEQDPEDWYQAFCATVRTTLQQVGSEPPQIEGVGVVGVTHNTVLLDQQGRPAAPCILIFDNRSTAQVQEIRDRWGAQVREKALNDVSPLWSWPQLLWIRQNRPEVWKAARHLFFQKDYVRHRLAPSLATDAIDASGSLLFDPCQEQWIERFCDDLSLNPDWLPAVVRPMDVVARVSRQGAADTGLVEGTPVIAGTSDTVAEVLGAGAVRPGSAVVKLASVGRIAIVSTGPLRKSHILNYRHVIDGLWYPGTASKSAASNYRWLRDVLWPDGCPENPYQRMDEAASRVPVGCDGLLFHPHLMGEWAPYWDDQMRGNFIGLTVRHGTAQMTRAVLEGVAFGLRDALSEIEAAGVKAEQIRLIGHGSNSRLWSQIVAGVLNRPLEVPEQPDAVYGAGLITAMAFGLIEKTPEAVESVITKLEKIEASSTDARSYDRLFALYREADSALRPIAAKLHEFERDQSANREGES